MNLVSHEKHRARGFRELRSAVVFAVILQALITTLGIAAVDGGVLLKASFVAFAGPFFHTFLVLFRRPRQPTFLDLLFIRIGSPAILLLVYQIT